MEIYVAIYWLGVRQANFKLRIVAVMNHSKVASLSDF